MATMTPMTTEPVYRDWEQLYDRHFYVLEDAVRRRDTKLLAALEIQSRLSDIDYAATFYKEARTLGPAAFNDASTEFREMEDRIHVSNNATKLNCDKVKNDLESLANSGDAGSKEEWENQFDSSWDDLEKKTMDKLGELKTWGKTKIQGMPQRLRPTAAKAFTGGAGAVVSFLGKAIDWLKGAIDTVTEWVKNAWAKISQWASATADWFTGAWNTIKGWFSVAYTEVTRMPSTDDGAAMSNPGGLNSLLKLESIANKLQKVGLDRFTLVRHESGWLIEPM